MNRGRYGLILDLDGTLVDSYTAIAAALNHARAHYKLAPLDATTVRTAVGHGLEGLIATWVGEDRVEHGVRLFRDRYGQVFESATRALPGSDAALRCLVTCGVRLALASNKPARFSRAILAALGWAPWFVAVEGPDTVGTTKPEPAMLRACLAALGTPVRRTRYVGDMPLDVESGRRAGLEVILVRGGSASDADLLAAGPPVLDGVAALPDYLNGLGWMMRRARPPQTR